MDKALLEYIIKIFALVANFYPALIIENIKDFLKSFLLKEFSDEIANESLQLFKEYYLKYQEIKLSPDGINKINQLLQNTIQQKNLELPRKQKFQVLLRLLLFESFLLKFVSDTSHEPISFSNIIQLFVNQFQISNIDFLSIKSFVQGTLYAMPDPSMLLIAGSSKSFMMDIKFLRRTNLNGQLFFLYIKSAGIFLFYSKGSDSLQFNDQPLFPEHIYLFHQGSSIKADYVEPIYYNQIVRSFLTNNAELLIVEAKGIEYKFANSNNGIHQLNVTFETGQLVGIIGRTGVGKSTLINILNGNIKPHEGTITYNQFDLWHNNDKLDGLIGYVPQDDLLVEELSVFTNLYLNASLCFGNLAKTDLIEKVNNVLVDFDLYDVRNLKVGTPLNKFISGGQRKKLNIALELIREPSVLFADEPTSGLSSSDSEEIMHLLMEQTINGKIIVVNIHQPSSDIFKLFDKIIVLDKEGYPVYFGNPLDVIPYFNQYTKKFSTSADYCNVCKTINSETIFKALEEKKVNEFGEYTKERKTSSLEWHNRYKSNYISKTLAIPDHLPEIKIKKPNSFIQFLIFGKRNVLSKLTNHAYIMLVLLVSPLLAFVLSVLCKSSNQNTTSTYTFAANDNIPSFLFMSVLVSLFVGLIISCEEIFRDKKILLRESYLRLNKASYINSKVAYIFILSAIQTILYVIISNSILHIQYMTLNFWLVLFSTSCFANLVGLLISSLFNSIAVIYIMVPLIIVPQILLSGVVIGFYKLNDKLSSKEYVPFVGDLMVSRWAFEALVVSQFEYNQYEKLFFDLSKTESNDKYNYLILIPEIKKALFRYTRNSNKSTKIDAEQLIKNGIIALNDVLPYDYITELSGNSITVEKKEKIEKYLETINASLIHRINRTVHVKDSLTNNLVKKCGGVNNYLSFMSTNTNGSITDLVLKRKSLGMFFVYHNKFIREIEPIFQEPLNKFGRAQFLASSKRIGNVEVETIQFNLLIIWTMIIILYISLLVLFYYKSKY